MTQAYSKELRVDTSYIIIPTISVITTLVSMLMMLVAPDFTDAWHLWVSGIGAPISGWLAWRLIKQDKATAGTNLFTAMNLLIHTLLLIREWEPGSAIPYVFAIFIIASSMYTSPQSGFLTWVASTLLILSGVFIKEGLDSSILAAVAPPIFINLFLAVMAYLSAMEWQFAVETVSDLHLNVQRRRDELFAVKEEVSLANARLKFSNEQLELARQEAIDERDLRTRFMNHVSHELRTPLNAIVNFAHILAKGGRGEINQSQMDYLQRIEQSGWHLLSVLNDLLDMAQIEAGEFRLHLETADLKPICDEAIASIHGLVLEKEVELIRDYPDEWPQVEVDVMRLKQSLLNLLGNAVKYTDRGHIAIRVVPDNGAIHIKIEDTGIGIPAAQHEIIFKEFHQLDETAARHRVGTGLGLPITRHLIERHNGQVTVESEVGKGSTFTITLPVVGTEAVGDDVDNVIPSRTEELPAN